MEGYDNPAFPFVTVCSFVMRKLKEVVLVDTYIIN